MPRLLEVKPQPGVRGWLRYDDGATGAVDPSDWSGRGVFKAWANPRFFDAVRLGDHGAIAWGREIGLCPDAIYTWLTRKSPPQVFPALRESPADA